MRHLRRLLLPLLALTLATTAVGVSANPASARPNCDVEDPPPICGPRQPPPPPPSVIGSFDSISVQPNQGGVQFRGWAIDRRTTAPINMRISVQSALGDRLGWTINNPVANVSRPDVGAAYPGYGDLHGFFSWWAIDSSTWGTHLACVDAQDTVTGVWVSLGCKTFTGF